MDAAPQTLLDECIHHERDALRAVDRRIFVDEELFELEHKKSGKKSGSMWPTKASCPSPRTT